MSRRRKEALLNLGRTAVAAHRELGIEPHAKGSREVINAAFDAQNTMKAAAAVLKAAVDRNDGEAMGGAVAVIKGLDPQLLSPRDRELQSELAERWSFIEARESDTVKQDELTRRDELLAEREVWSDRVDLLNAALIEHILGQRAAAKAGTRPFNGRVRGQAIGAL